MENQLGVPPPPPPGVEPVRPPRTMRWIVAVGILLILAAASNWIPVPIFYAYTPGPVKDIEDLVEVSEAKTYSSEGRLLLTTVNVKVDVTLADWVGAIFDRERTIVLKEEVTQGQTLEQVTRQQRAEMRASKRHAQEVALSTLGIARPAGDGARVRATVPASPAAQVLEEGDVIVRVDGRRVGTTCDVGRAIDAHGIGDPLRLTIKRDGATRTVTLRTIRNPENPEAPFIGVYMDEIHYHFEPGFEVEFETGEIAGPSAGLMFALALYDRLTPEDLTAGRDIAGTGTIACDGGVGPIGGVEQKVAGAQAQGAEIFLAPDTNAAAARTVADDIEVVAVSSFDEAVEYLEALD